MTQEIENIGFNNHGLLKFGWVEYKTNTDNRRRTPQTTEMQLRSMEELYEDRQCLISAMKNAERFISLVFGSDDEVWVARCYSIIRDRRLATFVILLHIEQPGPKAPQSSRLLINVLWIYEPGGYPMDSP
ncbi:hypothetical protein Forpe1208_v012538 [Fusarium oxysporum f. sp. rapae]|uniref:Uncharacterized protein n=1 Tax=Fusarium oxysporum f. sp. rapae TaxID=485398 RepID=A0A8J5NNS7_FUSOX|nr:hypothetical protein Forpe1208_v012538 [Fusarium oxysporum f. sp. rapae]